MKTVWILTLLVAMGVANLSPLMCEQILTWPYPKAAKGERRAWDDRGYNQWGGHDIWCINPMFAVCDLWTWRTIYPDATDVPAQTRCVEYGYGLVVAAAEADNITLPSGFGPEEYYEIGF